MRASRQPGVARSRCKTSPICGARRIAGSSRSLRQAASQAASSAGVSADRGSGSGGFSRRFRAAKTEAVATCTPGQASTSGRAGQDATVSMRSPVPRARSARLTRHMATSAPSAGASASKSLEPRPRAQSAFKACSAAAASAEPPPKPAPAGMFFSSRIAAPPRNPVSRLSSLGGLQHEIAGASRGVARKRAGDRKRQLGGGGDGDPVGDVGENRERVELVIAVRPPSQNVQREIDLGRGEPLDDIRQGACQIRPGMISCMPG